MARGPGERSFGRCCRSITSDWNWAGVGNGRDKGGRCAPKGAFPLTPREPLGRARFALASKRQMPHNEVVWRGKARARAKIQARQTGFSECEA